LSTVIGAFKTRDTANRAVDDLMAGGFRADQISVHTRDGKAPDITPAAAQDTEEVAQQGESLFETGTTGSNVGPLETSFVAAGGGGTDVGQTSSSASGVTGGLLGFFAAEGGPPPEAKHYADSVHSRGIYLVTVQTSPTQEFMADNILATAGAETPIQHIP
jgi:hypothetical protein